MFGVNVVVLDNWHSFCFRPIHHTISMVCHFVIKHCTRCWISCFCGHICIDEATAIQLLAKDNWVVNSTTIREKTTGQIRDMIVQMLDSNHRRRIKWDDLLRIALLSGKTVMDLQVRLSVRHFALVLTNTGLCDIMNHSQIFWIKSTMFSPQQPKSSRFRSVIFTQTPLWFIVC